MSIAKEFYQYAHKDLEKIGLALLGGPRSGNWGSRLDYSFKEYFLLFAFGELEWNMAISYGRWWLTDGGTKTLSNTYETFGQILNLKNTKTLFDIDSRYMEKTFDEVICMLRETLPIFSEKLTLKDIEQVEHSPPVGVFYIHNQRLERDPEIEPPRLDTWTWD